MIGKCEKHDVDMSSTVAGVVCMECAREYIDKIAISSAIESTRFVVDSKAEYESRQKKKIFDRIGIPPRFRDKTLKNYQIESQQQQIALKMVSSYAKRLCDDNQVCGGLIMSGNPGTGKTHLACAVANLFERSGGSVMFITVSGMIRKIRESYRRDADLTEGEAIALFVGYDLLVLDEVGVQKGDEKEINLMTEVINERYGHQKPTVLISNLSITQMTALLQGRIIDRMKEDGGMMIDFGWSSFRSKAAADKSLEVA